MPILTDDVKPVGFIDMDAPPVTDGEDTWKSVFALTAREIKEVEFAKLYIEQFGHGTDGHSRLSLIDRMNSILESLFEMNTQLLAENEHFRELVAHLPADIDLSADDSDDDSE